MHILFFSHYFPPEVNAPATRTHAHCKRWVRAGHRVTVVTCAPNCPNGVVYNGYKNRLKSVEIIDGIRVIRVWSYIAPNKGFLRRTLNYTSYMLSAVFYSLFIRKVDVAVSTSPQFFCGWAGVLYKWIKRKPFVLEIRDIWPESILTVGAMKKTVLIRFLERMEKKMYQTADRIVAVGEGYKKKITEKGIQSEKISVVMNGVSLDDFNPKPPVREVLERYAGTDKFVCAYIGTVGMAHGLEVVIKAAETLKNKNVTDTVFWIIGDGACREALQQEAGEKGLDNIIFTGRLPKEKMPDMIASCSACLVHLKGTELFGTVIPSKIFEFMAMNMPIIMGVGGEAQEIVLKADAGEAMTPDDPDSLMECIQKIKDARAGNYNGRVFVGEHFSRDTFASRMLDVLIDTNN